jgi:hypothetical protein
LFEFRGPFNGMTRESKNEITSPVAAYLEAA